MAPGAVVTRQHAHRVPEREGGTRGRNLFVDEVATGQRTQVTDLDLTTAGYYWLAPSFSPDGQSVVFHPGR